ncbi:MAG: TetR family transcriptional regulator [Candidatus Lokiarchaeota archaeon]|nr:TetR family transcriptional regulator [Candidatus Lokiarchaeota archaeon]
MVRITKDPEERRKEILETAKVLFQSIGYRNTTVEAIVDKAGIAKGTFYYYFKSKNDALAYIAQDIVDDMVQEALKRVDVEDINALEKLKLILRGQSDSFDAGYDLTEYLHQPENRELHERVNVEMIKKFGPVIAKVVEQGNSEGSFNVRRPLETVQFILAGSQFLLYSNIFGWSKSKRNSLTKAMICIMERSFGAKRGSFDFLQEPYKSSSKNQENEVG